MADGNNNTPEMIRAGHLGMGVWPKDWLNTEIEMTTMRKKWIEGVSSLVPPSYEMNVLDAGSGNGFAFLSLAKRLTADNRLVNVRLIDIQPEALDKLSDLVGNPSFPKSLKLHPIIGNITNIPLGSSSQHGVYSESVLPWLGNDVDIHKALEEFYRVTIPNGYVYIEVMSPFNNSSINNIPGKSRSERLREIERFISVNPDRPYIYHNPKYGRQIAYMSEPVLKALTESVGFADIYSSPIENINFPNGLKDAGFPDNIELVARKPS